MDVFAWQDLLRSGLAAGLSPEAMWHMTPKELLIYIKDTTTPALSRAELLHLMEQTKVTS